MSLDPVCYSAAGVEQHFPCRAIEKDRERERKSPVSVKEREREGDAPPPLQPTLAEMLTNGKQMNSLR